MVAETMLVALLVALSVVLAAEVGIALAEEAVAGSVIATSLVVEVGGMMWVLYEELMLAVEGSSWRLLGCCFRGWRMSSGCMDRNRCPLRV